jgi:hypothetical protein
VNPDQVSPAEPGEHVRFAKKYFWNTALTFAIGQFTDYATKSIWASTAMLLKLHARQQYCASPLRSTPQIGRVQAIETG